MFVLATPIVDWNAMWKIFLVVLVAGTGTVVAFGFLLLGLKLANRLRPEGTASGTQGEGPRLGGYVLAGACAVICIGVVVLGVYAMSKKPSSKPAKPKAALVIPAGPRVELTTASR
jgi:hypothetical protein